MCDTADGELKPPGKPTDGPVSRLINRRISGKISRWVVSNGIPLTPNQATLTSFMISLIPLSLYALRHPVLAGVIVQVASIIDGVDGEIARMRNMTSRFGTFIDAVLDRIGDLAMMLGAAVYAFETLADPTTAHLVVVLLAISGSLLVSYLHGRAEKDLGKHPVYFGRLPPVASRDVRLFVLFVGSVVGYVFEALLVIAALTLVYTLIKLIEVYKAWGLG